MIKRIININELLRPSHGPDVETDGELRGPRLRPKAEGEAGGPAQPPREA